MRKYILYFILFAMTSHLMMTLFAADEIQTPWHKKTAEGFPIFNGQLETTEGFGAYMDFCLRPNSKNFDNGGGSHDYNSHYLKTYHGVENRVFDPYQRDGETNQKTLEEVAKHDFDTATSNSVLNVIDNPEARLQHILLSCQALKTGGIAYFKIYQGDGSGIEVRHEDSYQSNRPPFTYQSEIEEVFGKGNVVVDKARHMIIAYKNSDCQK